MTLSVRKWDDRVAMSHSTSWMPQMEERSAPSLRAPDVPAVTSPLRGGATIPGFARLDPLPFVPLSAPRSN